MWRPTRRRLLAAGGALASAGLVHLARAQAPGGQQLRVGTVFPARTGINSTVATSVNDYVGQAARMGAILADRQIAEQAEAGPGIHILLANTPTAEAAQRAAQRLIAMNGVHALVGGIGDGQAEILSAAAEEARIPFLNIGSPRDALRHGSCGQYTFHVAASAAMYLDTMVAWSASENHRRWFVVHEDSEDGWDLQQRASVTIARHGAGGELVGSAATVTDQLIYGREMNAVRDSGADMILLLLDPDDQLVFLGQQESYRLDVPAAVFPSAVSQTRDYIAAARPRSGTHNPDYRFALWEATLESNGADAFNESFMSRWGEVTDPAAWASYQSIKILFGAALGAGSMEGTALIQYLESAEAVFDVSKGPGTSFRTWDHQLRQPLYLVRVNQEAAWTRLSLSSRVEIAEIAAELPNLGPQATNPAERLDQFGDGPDDSACRL